MQVEAFVESELGALLRFARVLTGDRGLAEDIVQDVVVRLVGDPDRFAALASPHAYVRRMVVNQFISWGRKWFRIRPTPHLAHAVVGDPADVVGEREELRRALAELPRRQRAVVVLRYYLELPDDEIAAALDCSVVTVRSHASRALAALRIAITETDRSVG